ncbi:YpfJ protein, zinc metalloprotease superfamily [Altererythrobacter epoxidivorans]|uniref:YpfJ protein, zinc metalloprotease superfamily n=1 Tax=Altererythrobacter epoxidivorans TaxID=361183 RepID=A0A0M4M7W2_9SPHN|nr:neutral zinc metallopeptidase [Altererythrobacter epoxidivorans]ALE16639.1 YpfJ protein, zinc metalloprotease superfamily [Altererythrobacter epoxidivorans]
MRLNPFNTDNIRVRSSGGGGGFPGGRGGGIGCGTIVIALIAYFVFGADPMQTIGAIEGAQQQAPTSQQSNMSEQEICTSGPYATEACNALQSLNQTWAPEFQRAGIAFSDPYLDLYRNGRVTTQGCGSATSAAGPFYCPADQSIYIDTSFYDQLAKMAGGGGDFARYYVMAHEYGHHIQNLTGLASQVRSAQQQNPRSANDLQVRMELQADCYAGVWAGKNRNLIEPGDMEEGMKAASAIGDDTLQRNAGQRVNPEGFTHGTSRQRMEALRLGMESADDAQCDRYFDMG